MDIKSPVGEARNTYTYTADGIKRKTLQQWNSNYSTTPVIGTGINVSSLNLSKMTDYAGNIIYENGSLKRILIEGGYIEGGVYYFYLTDHLGNNRVVANSSGAVIQKTHYYPFGMAFAESTDQGKQPYKYNGKEFDQMHGLNLYDYSARYMEPTLGRFTTVDPLAEKRPWESPYCYAGNDPVNRLDPTGTDWVEDKDGNAIWRAEYTKDNLSEGYKYIGTEYKIGNTKFIQKTNKKGEVSLYASVVEDKKSDQTSTQNGAFAPAIPWYITAGEIVESSALRIGGGILSLLFLTGDTDPHREDLVAIDAYYPPPIELPGFPGSVKDKTKTGRARWKLPNGDIGEWDSQHGEVEVYDKTGKKHKGAYDPKTGQKKKDGDPKRKTNN